jgi:hypothetical protein
MARRIGFLAMVLSCVLVQAQPPYATLTDATMSRAPVVELGPIVSNVVLAKVQPSEPEKELTIVKFGRAVTPQKTNKVTQFRVEQRTRKVVVNGNEVEQTYNVNVPFVTEVENPNFTPTEQSRSIPVSRVQAFDIRGKVVEPTEWMKALETPNTVLLINAPMDATHQLHPFFVQILRPDILLLHLKGDPIPKAKE